MSEPTMTHATIDNVLTLREELIEQLAAATDWQPPLDELKRLDTAGAQLLLALHAEQPIGHWPDLVAERLRALGAANLLGAGA